MDLPVIRLDRVFHVGSMDPSRLGENSGTSSQEGACLSVSLCPNAWAGIARLGDDLHVLETRDGLFLDAVALLADEAARRDLLAWAVEADLVEMRTLWRAWSFDEDAGDWRFVLCASRQGAIAEADVDGDDVAGMPAPEGHVAVEPVEVPVGTFLLRDLTGFAVRPDEDASDAVVAAFALVCAHEVAGRPFDGVWWTETFAPELLSAPRGGIFPDRVKQWSVRRMPLDDVDDEAELDRMPDGEMLRAAAAPAI